jgi:hypothetical protein
MDPPAYPAPVPHPVNRVLDHIDLSKPRVRPGGGGEVLTSASAANDGVEASGCPCVLAHATHQVGHSIVTCLEVGNAPEQGRVRAIPGLRCRADWES